jgi:hypothetical protein
VTATETGILKHTKTKSITYDLAKVSGEKVPANQKYEQEISFTLPTDLPKGYCPWGYYMPNKQGDVTDTQRALLLKPTPSYMGVAIKSQYVLRVLFKHDAWNEFGEGTPLEIPITVL